MSESLSTPAEADSRKDQGAWAYVDRLDGAERKLLLDHIAQAFPEVVEAGAGLVAEWRAECAEHRRKRQRRNEHDRRKRKARQGWQRRLRAAAAPVRSVGGGGTGGPAPDAPGRAIFIPANRGGKCAREVRVADSVRDVWLLRSLDLRATLRRALGGRVNCDGAGRVRRPLLHSRRCCVRSRALAQSESMIRV